MINKLLSATQVTIQSKLVQIIVTVSTVSLLLAATLFTLVQLREHRLSMIESLTSTASITAENIQAAVLFQNENDAYKILTEFRNDSRILTAAVYTEQKNLFVAYDLTESDLTTLYDFSSETSYLFAEDQLHLKHPITLPGTDNIIGYVYLRASLDSLYQQLQHNILIIAVIVIFVLLITLLLTSKLQKIISSPILELSKTTKSIKDVKDFSIRVEHDDYLEISQLCDGFNSMLKEIQIRDEHLQRMALYDELTGIPNRSLFIDHFHRAIAHSKRSKTQLAVCFLDLDNFKPINDNFGHEIGDKLLIEVAKRITGCIRHEDTVSRQGGDEFAILLGDLESGYQYEKTLGRIHHAISQPFVIDNYSHQITASSGITLYPTDEADIDTLIRHADQAMYHAKLSGKHRYHLFNPQHDKSIIQKHHRLSEIEQALENDELCLFYQPKVNMMSGDVFGAEALLRWKHPQKGIIPPLEFLPIIEGFELESQIGDWVINQAMFQLDTWQAQGIKLEVSVNISSHHLQSEAFLLKLETTLAKYPKVAPKLLQLEILESSALGDIHIIKNIIRTCQNTLGVSIALDDFGTGYSSLTHLRNLPANTIKIDQSFVRDMLDDPSDFAIVDGVIGLTDSFNRNVIAEGVETTEHGLMLLISGCHEAQGYGIAKPMHADEIPIWLTKYTPNERWLRCSNTHRTITEKKLDLFNLIVSHWYHKVAKSLEPHSGNQVSRAIIDDDRCHCCEWLKRAKQEQLFAPQWLDKLHCLHNEMHRITNTLNKRKAQDRSPPLLQDLSELDRLYNELYALLDNSDSASTRD